MSRSHDRVIFTINERYLQKETIRNALFDALNVPQYITKQNAARCKNMTFRCRPSQFARFIILRHIKYNEPNNMACLDMKLIPGEACEEIVDVSDNPNRVHESVG